MIKKDIKIHFLIKFLKSLNSAESSKALSLSLAVGLISGFLPSFNIINILILLIVFSFRIPIGLDLANMDLNKNNKTLDSFKNKLKKYGKKELEKKIVGNSLNKLKSLF